MTKTFDPNKPVQTRDGKKARILCTNRVGDRPIVALVTSSYSSREYFFFYDEEGHSGRGQHPTDLVNIPERRSEFRALYSGARGPYVGQMKFLSLESAVNFKNPLVLYIAILEFVYEDDEIVDVKMHPRKG